MSAAEWASSAPPPPPPPAGYALEQENAAANGTGADLQPAPLQETRHLDLNRKPKRSRWGNISDTTTTSGGRKRRSRWGAEEDKVELTAEMAAATAAMTPEQRELYFLRLRLQDVTLKLANLTQCI
ncbi:hypothetical protein BVRB_029550, partial [Beta vulgaris subsp. vulgaris]